MAWTPASIASLQAWFDPSVGLVNGTSWTDRAAGITLLTTASGGTDMVHGTGINNQPTVNVNLAAGGTYLYNTVAWPISISAWTIAVVFNYTGSTTETANPYTNPFLVGDFPNTYWGITVSTTKVDSYQYDTTPAYKKDQVSVASPGAHYIIAKFDGTKIYTSVDGGAFDAGVASGNIDVAGTGEYGMWTNNGGSAVFKGYAGDVILCNAAISTGDFNNLVAWLNARYGISPPVQALRAPQVVQSNDSSASNSVSTVFLTGNVPGNTGIALAAGQAAFTTGVTDTDGNTWSLLGQLNDATDGEIQSIYWCPTLNGRNAVANVGNTVTAAWASGSNELYVLETTPAQLDAVLGVAFNDSAGVSSTTATSGKQTPHYSSVLWVSFCTTAGSVSTAGPGMTLDPNSPASFGTGLEYGAAGGSPFTATFGMTGSTTWLVSLLALRSVYVAAPYPTGQLVTFTSEQTWLCPPDVKTAIWDGFGGGGGGGGGEVGTGGGGGGGAIRECQPLVLSPGQLYACSIGPGGALGAIAANGSPGGDSTFGTGDTTIAVASGASGGQGTSAVANAGGKSFKGTGGVNVYGQAASGAQTLDVAQGGDDNERGARNITGGYDGGTGGGGSDDGGGGGAGPEGPGGSQGVGSPTGAATAGGPALPNSGAGGGGGGGTTSGTRAAGNVGGSGKAHLHYASRYPPVGQFAPGTWLPTQMPGGGPVLWLRADQGITLATGVSQWNDLSGNGNNATQATGADQPTYNASDAAYNGQATISFSGTTQWFTLAQPLPAQPYTVYVVGQANNNARQQWLFSDSSSGGGGFILASGDWSMYAGNTVSSSSASVNVPQAFAFSFNGASSSIWVGTSQAPTTGNAGTLSPGGFTQDIGAAGAGGQALAGKIAEFVVFLGAHSNAQVSNMFTYFAVRY